jgi:hypothetical protein
MFTGSPVFVQFSRYGRRASQGAWWLVMGPGLLLTLMALAIIAWPALLAYMIASVMLFAGLWLTVGGWTMRRAEQRQRQQTAVYYKVS